MEGKVEDKILLNLAGKPVIRHSVDAFLASKVANEFVVVYRDAEQRSAIESLLADLKPNYKLAWVQGGDERQDSVYNGLSEASIVNSYVFIHDCARPLIRPQTICDLADGVRRYKAISIARPVVDTLKMVKTNNNDFNHCTLESVDRSHLWAMETPQVFDLETILESYRRLRYNNIRVTDDTSAFCYEDGTVSLLNPGYLNPKLTTPADIPLIEFLLKQAYS